MEPDTTFGRVELPQAEAGGQPGLEEQLADSTRLEAGDGQYSIQYNTIQYSTVQYNTAHGWRSVSSLVLYCIVSYCTELYCIVLYCFDNSKASGNDVSGIAK